MLNNLLPFAKAISQESLYLTASGVALVYRGELRQFRLHNSFSSGLLLIHQAARTFHKCIHSQEVFLPNSQTHQGG